MPGYPGAMQPQYLPIQQLPPGGYVPSYAMYHPGYGTPLPPPSSGLPPVTSSHGHARPPQMYQVLPSMNGLWRSRCSDYVSTQLTPVNRASPAFNSDRCLGTKRAGELETEGDGDSLGG